MSEGEFNHFPNLGHLLAAATDVIVAYVIKLFLVLPVDGLAFSVQHGVGSNDTELLWLSGDYFELDGLEVAAH